jgi:hypothetical protein
MRDDMEDEIGRNTRGSDEKCIQSFGRKNFNRRDHLEDLGVDVGIILQLVLKKQGVDWSHVT